MRRYILALLLGLVTFPACGHAAVSPPAETAAPKTEFDAMLGLMRSRLDVMHDVARWKWAAKAPIEDPGREAALLRDVAERGKALGLDPATTRAFFAAQIEAAKLVQRADFRRWEDNPQAQPTEAPDLAGVLRPRIDALNRRLLEALTLAAPRLRGDDALVAILRSRADKVLVGDGIDAEVRAMALRSLAPAAP
jgi:chorismate mutase